MEEYDTTIIYYPGAKYVITNIFSCFPLCDVLPITVRANAPVLFDATFQGLYMSYDHHLLKCLLNSLSQHCREHHC